MSDTKHNESCVRVIEVIKDIIEDNESGKISSPYDTVLAIKFLIDAALRIRSEWK